jgi:WS/DGAT/MGAT family acyltransferase
MVQASLADRVFLAFDTVETAQHVALCATFAPPARAAPDFCQELVTKLRRAGTVTAPFTYRLASARPGPLARSWHVLAPGAVDLSYHVRRTHLPAPGSDDQLAEFVAELHSRPLDPTCPLWECHLIEGLADGRFALYIKIHHAVIDGVTGMRRIGQMLSFDPEDARLRPIWTIDPVAAGGETGGPRRIGPAIATAGEIAVRMAGWLRRSHDPDFATPFGTPRSMFNRRIGSRREVAMVSWPLDRLRRVAQAAGATVNEVLLSSTGGALRHYVAEFGEPGPAQLTAGTPMSLRRPQDTQVGNVFTMAIMRLGAEVADPIERIRAVRRSSESAKTDLRALSREVAALNGLMFTIPFVAQHATGWAGVLRPPYNVVVSNVAGPSERQYLAGARLESLYPLGSVCHGMALFVAAFSAGPSLHIGVTGAAEALSHPKTFATYLENSFTELESALCNA